MLTMKKLILLMCTLLTLFSTSTSFAYNGNAEDISLNTTVEREVAPDLAYIHLTIIGTGNNPAEATQRSAAKAAELKKQLLKHALTSDMLKQVSYRINPVYNDKQKVIAYKANNQLKIEVNKLASLGEIIDTISNAGVDRISNIEYTLKNKEYYQNLVLQDAVVLAKSKARIVAESAGRTLGRMLSARLNSCTTMPKTANYARMAKAASNDAVQPETVLESKTITIKADIEAVFALE